MPAHDVKGECVTHTHHPPPSHPHTLTPPTAGVLITQDLPQSLKLRAGDALSLRVCATGAGQLTFEWLQNGDKLRYAHAHSEELQVVGLTPDNQGNYCVRISNAVNSVLSKTCQVIGECAPVVRWLVIGWLVSAPLSLGG